MDFEDLSKAVHVLNRAKWIDEKTMLITNEEGIEKIIDIENNFSEMQYNYRPIFNEIDGREYEKYFYYI